jgi:general stress protein 26
MEKQEAINQGLELVNRSTIAMLGTNGEDGFPNKSNAENGKRGIKEDMVQHQYLIKKDRTNQKKSKSMCVLCEY